MSYFIWVETVSEQQASPCRQVIYFQQFHRAGLAGVIVSERDTKKLIGLSGKRRKTEWICILSQGLCNRKQTAGHQQIRTRSSSLSLSQCSDTVQPCRQCLHSQRTAIGQECSMGRRPDTQALGKCSYRCLRSGLSLGLPLHLTLQNDPHVIWHKQSHV